MAVMARAEEIGVPVAVQRGVHRDGENILARRFVGGAEVGGESGFQLVVVLLNAVAAGLAVFPCVEILGLVLEEDGRARRVG